MQRLLSRFLILLALTLGASLAASAEPAPGAIALRGSPVRLASGARLSGFERGPAWRSFATRHGRWSATWNEVTGSPHRAVGPPIALPGFRPEPESVDRAVRGFVEREPALFGSAVALEAVAIQRARNVWYARYRQTFHGIPVLFADWEFRINPNGGLMAFGADAHQVPEETPTQPLLAAAVAREAARAGLDFDPLQDRLAGGDRLWLVPWSVDGATSYRLAYEVEVQKAQPPASWVTLVDARNGEVLWRQDRVRHAVSGAVTGQVQLTLPTDPLTTRAFAHQDVSVDGGTVTTDLGGLYSGAASGSAKVLSKLSGPFCVVDRPGNMDASFNLTVQDPATVNIAWSGANSLDSERDGYYHVNLVHDYVKALDPGFTLNDYAMPCRVELTGDVCNAFWDGAGVNFYAAGGGCPSIGTLPDVIYHEYGHSVNDHVYRQAGVGFGMLNGALHEGMADVLSALLTDDPAIGSGVFGPGTSWRTLSNAFRWPEDRSGDPHVTGLIIGGAFWDLRQSLGLTLATQLSHFAKYGTPDDPDDGVAMSEYFFETLIADDDDGNLSNGTPHFAQINAAFDAHGIGTGYYLGIAHTPLADQPLPGSPTVTATITYAGPFGALDATSPALHYSVNNASFAAVAMTPTVNPGEYSAPLPAVGGAIVRYWIGAADVNGGTAANPRGAPSQKTHLFLAGAVTQVLSHDQEADQGWTVGAPGDAATTGLWLRADPVGTAVSGVQVQPEFDHTVDPGALCFVTGNAAPGDAVGTADVDGGATTLLTPVFSATGLTNPVIEYYRWYSNNGGGDPGTELWRVDLSIDGGASWIPVENTHSTDNSWRRVLLMISDYGAPTATMRLRFVASDLAPASLVEAAVDDFRLLTLPVTTGVEPQAAPQALRFRAPQPNPFAGATTLRYTLPNAARVSLQVHDVTGRVVRHLEDGPREAGEHALRWDGRDDLGRTVASGTYFARLAINGERAVRTVVRIR